MTAPRETRPEHILVRIDALLHAANEAGKDYDYLTFEAEAIPPSDFRDTLGYWLSDLQDGLAELSKDLSTLPFLVS